MFFRGPGGAATYGGVVQRARRKRIYFILMGTCVVLIVLAWNVVRLWSTTLAVAMSIVAAVLPPAAVIVANMGALDDHQDDERDDGQDDEGPGRRTED